MQNKNAILGAFAALGSLLANLFGGIDAVLALLLGMMAADYATGLLLALFWQRSNKSSSGALDSRAGFRGLCKKGVILLLVYLGHLLDRALGADYIRTAVVFFFIGNEGLSLLENVALMGLPFPPALKRALEVLQDKGEEQAQEERNNQQKEGK